MRRIRSLAVVGVALLAGWLTLAPGRAEAGPYRAALPGAPALSPNPYVARYQLALVQAALIRQYQLAQLRAIVVARQQAQLQAILAARYGYYPYGGGGGGPSCPSDGSSGDSGSGSGGDGGGGGGD